jgi:hypothetical protein
VLKSIDPIVFSCYYTIFEYYLALGLYVDTISDFNKLLYNLTHNLGPIYDMVEEFVYRMMDAKEEWKRGFFWHRSGTILGSLFQFVLEDPENYYPFDPNNW